MLKLRLGDLNVEPNLFVVEINYSASSVALRRGTGADAEEKFPTVITTMRLLKAATYNLSKCLGRNPN